MAVTALEHVNIRTQDLDGSARFYADLLGLEIGLPPMAIAQGTARWLHDTAGRPIIHLRLWDGPPEGHGAIDHVALACTDKAGVIARLEATGAPFDLFEATPTHSLLFTRDPHGVMLELNFRDE